MASKSAQEGHLSSQEEENLINDTVRYILSHDNTKYAIKRQDIVKDVLKTYGGSSKYIIDGATRVLKEIFGMKLVAVEQNSNVKHYMLINNEKFSTDARYMKWPKEVESQQVLLMLTLSLIFMKGGVESEEDMLSFLSNLGIMSKNRSHEYFGDVWKLLTGEFVRQMYLEHVRIPELDPPKFEFRWGRRAEEEVSRRSLLEFVSLVYGTDPKNWTTQYQEVLQTEKNKREKEM
ncbi:non-structural maintenance of chromosomes element 3 homolog isoform X2 [Zootermopsis nevadensis]|uniref:Melanoma-associated antigen G1 n=2 Tax=Zootermopsis nevadensis TaxID=136037 RepID=A0A067RNC7_ZOONE|nr:non-structural maintenance of chromosomes element 3 homolog isoform X2 [Zootermopsis nevadensis]KDR24548.1 Melanoma-associated antigen G1 [Zootermopsis nevadensis]